MNEVYRILAYDELKLLQEAVNRLMETGYSPIGGVVVIVDPIECMPMFLQTLVLPMGLRV